MFGAEYRRDKIPKRIDIEGSFKTFINIEEIVDKFEEKINNDILLIYMYIKIKGKSYYSNESLEISMNDIKKVLIR